MAETLTANYGWTKPDPGASANTWGATLNADLDAIDAQVFTNQQAGVPIGSGSMWFAATPPANWLICDGSSLATTGTYAALFAIIGYTFGGSGANFNLPNLQGRFPAGSSGVAPFTLAATGGVATVTLDATMIPAHTHPITDHTHNHGVTPVAHNHGDAGHNHPASGSQSPHSHTVVGGQLTNPGPGSLTPGGPALSLTPGSTDTQQPAVSVSVGTGFAAIQPASATVTLSPAATGITATNANTGGGAAHTNLPPFLAINFIIKFA